MGQSIDSATFAANIEKSIEFGEKTALCRFLGENLGVVIERRETPAEHTLNLQRFLHLVGSSDSHIWR